LWVRYAGVFKDRILESVTTAPANNSVSVFNSASAGEVPTTATPFTLALAVTNTNGLTIVNTAGSMVPAAGNYLVDVVVTVTSTVAITSFQLALEKNAAAVPNYSSALTAFGAAAVATELTMGDTYFVTANGTDAFTLIIVETSGGTLAAYGNVRWLAV